MAKYEDLSPQSRVWIYQSSRPFSEEEEKQIRYNLTLFADQWVSHNRQLRAYGDVYYRQFIVLMVDETQAGASGCSIDASVRFLKEIEQALDLSLFERLNFAYKDGETVQAIDKEAFVKEYQLGNIKDDTLVFDNLVNTKGDFEKSWLKPLAQSWHKRFV